MMGNRQISHKHERNVLSSCITPAYMNAPETMALTEKQQEKVQVCGKQPDKKILGIKRDDKRRIGGWSEGKF